MGVTVDKILGDALLHEHKSEDITDLTTTLDPRYVNTDGDTITGDLIMQDAATPAKSYRFRTSGSALDFDAAGNSIYLSVYDNVDFTGTQRQYMIIGHLYDYVTCFRNWEWKDSSSNVQAQINPNGGFVFNEGGTSNLDTRIESDTEENMVLVDASTDKTYLGGTTNGLEIAKGGKLTALGTATWYDDVRVEPTVRGSGTKVPAYTAWTPAGGSVSGLYCYLFDNAVLASEKEVNFKIQLPHGKKLGSVVHLHVHWMPTSTGSAGQKVRWGLEYTKANPNAAFAAPGAFIYATDPINPPSTTPTQDTHYITEFADIDMTGDALSTIILCRLFRNSSHADDSFTGNVMLLYIDCHVEHDTLGSNDEYTK